MRVSSTANAKRAGSLRKPHAKMLTTHGMNAHTTMRKSSWAMSSSVKTRSANSLAGSVPPCWRMRA